MNALKFVLGTFIFIIMFLILLEANRLDQVFSASMWGSR